jgi:hypothetical protein
MSFINNQLAYILEKEKEKKGNPKLKKEKIRFSKITN